MTRIAGLFALLLLTPVMLQARGLLVGPSQLGIVGKPGQTVSGIISVWPSRPDQKNDVRVVIEDFTRDETGSVVTLDEPGPRSAKAWVDVDRTSFQTADSGAVEVKVTATIPAQASGSYWALVSFEALPPQTPGATVKQGIAIQVLPKVSIPVVVTVLESGEKLDVAIVESKAIWSTDSHSIECEATVENRGNLAILLSGAFALEKKANEGDEELSSVDIASMTLLPGTKLKLKGTIPTAQKTGGTQVHTYLVYGEKSGEGTESVTPVTEPQSVK